MLRCIEEHTVPGFGTIPVGSLWAADSPYVADLAKFAALDAKEAPAPVKAAKKPATRKFGEKVSD